MKAEEKEREEMHPKVRDLYKRFLLVGRDYPAGLQEVKKRVKTEFFANRDLSEELDIFRAVAKGRYFVREIMAVNQLHKYRTIKKNYDL